MGRRTALVFMLMILAAELPSGRLVAEGQTEFSVILSCSGPSDVSAVGTYSVNLSDESTVEGSLTCTGLTVCPKTGSICGDRVTHATHSLPDTVEVTGLLLFVTVRSKNTGESQSCGLLGTQLPGELTSCRFGAYGARMIAN